MIVMHDDLLKDAVVSATTELSGFPASDVQHPFLSHDWETASSAAQRIVFDAASDLTLTCVAILGHNLTSAAVVRVEGNAADSWGAPTLSVTVDPDAEILLAYLPAGSSFRYWSVYIDDPTNPDAMLSVGKISGYVHWSCEDVPDRPVVVGAEDSSVEDTTVTGQTYSDTGVVARTYELSLGLMKDSTRQALAAVYVSVGRRTPLILVPDERNMDRLPPLYCRMMKVPRFTGAGGWLWRDDVLSFKEAF
jgi:hypothetical protein